MCHDTNTGRIKCQTAYSYKPTVSIYFKTWENEYAKHTQVWACSLFEFRRWSTWQSVFNGIMKKNRTNDYYFIMYDFGKRARRNSRHATLESLSLLVWSPVWQIATWIFTLFVRIECKWTIPLLFALHLPNQYFYIKLIVVTAARVSFSKKMWWKHGINENTSYLKIIMIIILCHIEWMCLYCICRTMYRRVFLFHPSSHTSMEHSVSYTNKPITGMHSTSFLRSSSIGRDQQTER